MTFNSILLLTDFTKSTKISDLAKMTFSDLIRLKIMKAQDMMDFFKNSAVFGTQAVLKSHISQNMYFHNSI